MYTIKRYLIAFFFFFAFTNIAKSQQLTNTYWTAYDTTNTLGLYWHFDLDSLYFSSDNILYITISSYFENANTFKLVDIPTSQCATTDTGEYTFQIQNDTLRFTPIYDQCLSRLGYYTNHYFVSFATGIEFEHLTSSFRIFPNPFRDELNISSGENEWSEFIFYDITSRIILQQEFTGSVSINVEQLSKGIYVYELRNNNGLIRQGKVVKE